ncbi:protein of unknown function, partial [Pseudomonas inefficax]
MSAVLVLGLVAAFQRTFRRRVRLIVDLGVLFPQVGVGDIDGHVVVRAPTGTKADRFTVTGRNARRAIMVVGGRLVDGEACTQGPLLVHLVGSTNGVCPGVVPVLLFGDGLQWVARRCFVLDNDTLQAAPARPGATRIQGPMVIQLMGDREVHRLWRLDFQAGVELAAETSKSDRVGNTGIAFKLVVDHRVVGQTQAGTVCGLYKNADVVADGSVVALDLDFAIRATAQKPGEGLAVQVRAQLTLDAVDGRAKTDRHLVVEGIADGWLEGDNLDLALLAPVTRRVAAAVVGDQAVWHVNAEANAPVVIDRLDIVTHGHAHDRDHVAIGFPPEIATTARNIGFGYHGRTTHGDLFAVPARHACGVAIHSAGIFGRRRTSRETG